jgi:PIN domain nuclease of toxin-antitoxin system
VSILLDTHVVLWWQAGGDRLSLRARQAIDDADELLVSPLSLWEIATLNRRGRVELDRDVMAWCRDLLGGARVATAPTSPDAATWAGTLADDFPGDPIDRLLYATARDLRIPFVTKDERLHAYAVPARDVTLVW